MKAFLRIFVLICIAFSSSLQVIILKAQVKEKNILFYTSTGAMVSSQKANYEVKAYLENPASGEQKDVESSQAYYDFSAEKALIDEGYVPKVKVHVSSMQSSSGRFSLQASDVKLSGGDLNVLKTSISNAADGSMDALVTLDPSKAFFSGWLQIEVTDSQGGGKGKVFDGGWKFYARFDAADATSESDSPKAVSPCELYAKARGVEAVKTAIKLSEGMDCQQGFKDRLCELAQQDLDYLISINATAAGYDEFMEAFPDCPDAIAKAKAEREKVADEADVFMEKILLMAKGDSTDAAENPEMDVQEEVVATGGQPSEIAPVDTAAVDTTASDSAGASAETTAATEETEAVDNPEATAQEEVKKEEATAATEKEAVNNTNAAAAVKATVDTVAKAVAETPKSEAVKPPTSGQSLLQDETAWQMAIMDKTVEAYKGYLKEYPQGTHATEAKAKIAEATPPNTQQETAQADSQEDKVLALAKDEAAWQIASAENTLEGYKKYLSDYPEARHKEEAVAKVAELEAKAKDSDIMKLAKDEAAWQLALQANHLADYQGYLKEYPDGRHMEEAKQKVDSLKEIQMEQEILEKAKDEVAWQLALKVNATPAFEEYLKQYPKGIHVEEAKAKLEELKKNPASDEDRIMRLAKDEISWTKAKGLNTLQAYKDYLAEYPEGLHADEARTKIKELE